METHLKCVSYLRVSGESQIAGDGFPRQREKIQSYATQNGITIVSEFLEEGVTGKMELEGRSALSACLQYVRENGVGMVLCESSDRLARDMIVAEVIIREFQKIGVKVISASGGVDLTEGDDSNPTAKLIRQILAAVSEFDRCVIVLKLRGARERKRLATGKGEGRKAYGDNPEEKPILARMLALQHQEGYSVDRIAKTLNDEGVLTRYGKRWSWMTISRILARNKSESIAA
jgi:DNA invertase Pin-like site-specific DNA recombinase